LNSAAECWIVCSANLGVALVILTEPEMPAEPVNPLNLIRLIPA
jgi:hypothetical protein